MKKFFMLILFVTILSMSLYAGGAGEKKVKDDVSDPLKQFSGVTLHMIAEQSAPTDSLKTLLPDFEKMTGIKVDLETAPYDDVVQKETLAFASGQGMYDVISAPYEFLGNMVENGYIQSIEPFLNSPKVGLVPGFDKNDFVKKLWDACGEWKGKLYGTPANPCTMFFGYRKDVFENEIEKKNFKSKYGYELEIPATWKEYKDMAEFFTRKRGENLAGVKLTQDFYGVSMSGKRHPAMVFEWMNYMWSFGGAIFDEKGNLVIDSKENEAALSYYVDLAKYAPPGVTSKTWDEQTTEIQQGIVAMAILFNDCAPSIEDENESNVAGKMGYGQIPAEAMPVSHFGGWGFYIPSDSKNAEAAWLFLEWYNTPKVQSELARQGIFPCLTSTYNDPEFASIPYWEASKDAYDICSSRPRIPEWNNMCEVMQLELSKAIAKEKSPKAALASVNSAFIPILQDVLPVLYQ
ncbi:MAG: sugar ABC transporter substrate-binding protein [Sphaerochaetaceae bacterium]